MNIKEVLMERDNLSENEAYEMILSAIPEFSEAIDNQDFDHAEDVLADYFGLEPDYITDLLGYVLIFRRSKE